MKKYVNWLNENKIWTTIPTSNFSSQMKFYPFSYLEQCVEEGKFVHCEKLPEKAKSMFSSGDTVLVFTEQPKHRSASEDYEIFFQFFLDHETSRQYFSSLEAVKKRNSEDAQDMNKSFVSSTEAYVLMDSKLHVVNGNQFYIALMTIDGILELIQKKLFDWDIFLYIDDELLNVKEKEIKSSIMKKKLGYIHGKQFGL